MTRDLATGVGRRAIFPAYRPPGLPWILHLLWHEEGAVVMFRAVVAAFGLGLVAATWALSRHLFGRRAGLVAAAGVALTPPLLAPATQVLTDIPGACMGLLAITLFVLASGGERPSWWILCVVPAAAGAIYLRFGAGVPMAVGLVAVALWRRRVLRQGWAAVAVTASGTAGAVVAILTVPKLTGTGESAWASMATLKNSVGGWLSGFAGFARAADEMVAPAAVALAVAGLAAVVVWATRREIEGSALAFSVAVGGVTALAIAALQAGEVRYLAPAYPWLWVAGAPGLERMGLALPGPVRRVVTAVLAATLIVAGVGGLQVRNGVRETTEGPIRQVSEAIADLAAGRPCTVVTSRLPQMMWYSGCEVVAFNKTRVAFPEPRGRLVFMVILPDPWNQPQGEVLAAYRAAAGKPVVTMEAGGLAQVYLVSDAETVQISN
jgi:hypothetical protein